MNILLRRLIRLRTWHLLLISVVSSEVFTLLLNTFQSIIVWKKVSSDLLLIGTVDAFLVSLVVTSFMLPVVKYAARLLAEKEALEGEMGERRRAENALREHQTFLETIIESEPECVKLLARDGTLIRMNRAGLDMIQADFLEEVKGKSVYPLITSEYREAFQRITEEVFEGKTGRLEFQMAGLKGRVLWMDTIAVPLRNERNEIVASLGITRDVTGRRLAERELQRSNDLLRAIIEAAPTAIIGMDLDGNVQTVWNPAAEKLLGWSAREVMGRPLPSVPAERQEEFRLFRERIRRGETIEGVEVHRQRRDGTPIDYSIYASPLYDVDGGIAGNIAVLVDITERKRMEEQLFNVAKGVSAATGEIFFRSLVEYLAKALGVHCALIGELTGENTGRVRTIATYVDGGIVDNLEYALAGTPCENVVDRELCVYPGGVQESFPSDLLLKKMGIESYAGVPLFDSSGKALGIIAVLHRQPLRDGAQLGSMLRIFATRAAAELERSNAEKELCKKSQELTTNLDAQSAVNALLRLSLEESSLDEILRQALDRVLSMSWLPSDKKGAIFLAGTEPGSLDLKALQGFGEDMMQACKRISYGQCLCGKAAATQEIQFAGAVDDRHEIRYDGMSPHGQYCVPIVFSGKTLGVMNLHLEEGHVRREGDEDFLRTIASALAGIIQRRQMKEEKEKLISELKDLIAVVSRSQREWQETFDSITDLIFLSDLNFTITRVNRAAEKVLDMPLIQTLGKRCHELIHGAAVRPDFCYGCKTAKTGKMTVAEMYEPHLNRHIEVRVIPRFDKQDQLVGLIHVIRDMTEHKKLEEQLAQAQKMEAVGQLAGGIAHDFNNILTSIIGCGNLLQMKLGGETPLATYINYILDASQKGASLVRGLLAFSRKEMFYPAPVDLNETIRELELFVRRTITEDIELRMDLADEMMTVMADKTQIGQVLINLVANARDAMPAGGIVHVTTERFELEKEFAQLYGSLPPGVYARISVSDSGTGIDEKTRERIFDPFFTTKEVGKGTGLGLSIVYGIIKQHNGHIMVDSTQGIGTAVQMYLPIVRADGDIEEAKEPSFVKGGNETILYAEDDSIVRNIVKDLLQEFGYEVIEAADGEDAVHKFIEHRDRISLSVLDVVMPGMNGKEAYDRIKSLQPGAKTLFMSGYASEILQSRFIHEDGLHFLQKPVSPVKLLTKIRQLLDM